MTCHKASGFHNYVFRPGNRDSIVPSPRVDSSRSLLMHEKRSCSPFSSGSWASKSRSRTTRFVEFKLCLTKWHERTRAPTRGFHTFGYTISARRTQPGLALEVLRTVGNTDAPPDRCQGIYEVLPDEASDETGSIGPAESESQRNVDRGF